MVLKHSGATSSPMTRPATVLVRRSPTKIAFLPELLFVALMDSRVVGTVMAGYDGHRGWLYPVAVDRQHRREGVATAMVRHAEQALAALGCVKINLQVRAGNEQVAAFYESIGYVVEPRVSMGKQLVDEAVAATR